MRGEGKRFLRRGKERRDVGAQSFPPFLGEKEEVKKVLVSVAEKKKGGKRTNSLSPSSLWMEKAELSLQIKEKGGILH